MAGRGARADFHHTQRTGLSSFHPKPDARTHSSVCPGAGSPVADLSLGHDRLAKAATVVTNRAMGIRQWALNNPPACLFVIHLFPSIAQCPMPTARYRS